MWKTIVLALLICLMAACAAVVRTGTVEGNVFSDTRQGFNFRKHEDWKFSIPTEKQNENQVVRFSLFRLKTWQSRGGGLKPVPIYSESKDPGTGRHIYRFRRAGDARTATVTYAETHFCVDTTSMDIWRANELLLAEHPDFRFVSVQTFGELGQGHHLTDEKRVFGDIYFVVSEEKLYVVYFSAVRSHYYKSREELEQMLSTFTLGD